MQRHALAFRVRPGTEAAVASLLSGYAPPALEAEDGTRLLGTAVFMKDNLVVRVMELEGSLESVGRHLAADPNIQAVERELNQYLAEPINPADPAQRREFVVRRLMQPVIHREAIVGPDGKSTLVDAG